jgi:ubiquinone biosynthesis protein
LTPGARSLRSLARTWRIARTLARYRALPPFEPDTKPLAQRVALRILGGRLPIEARGARPGQRVALALQSLGPAFIKLGQALSVRSDLFGEVFASDLSQLQDRLPPFSSEEAKKTIEAELGKSIANLFYRFDDEPVAAASIAQVHGATTIRGEAVAVKVLRLGIEAAFARDLELLVWLAELTERWRPDLRRLRPVEVVRTLIETVDCEMDLRYEAAAADEVRANFADDPTFRVPRVDWSLTSRKVLTTEWIDGVSIDERAALVGAGHDLADIVARMAKVFFLQAFRDGFFHADLHPGNLSVSSDGTINAVDFGIMGRLDKRTRQYLAEMLLGFLTADYRRVAEVHFRAGYVPADQSVEAFAQAARSIAEPILGRPLREISIARLLAQLFHVTERFKMPAQPQLLLLQKTMLIAEGVGRRLHPETNMWELARPLIEEWIATHLGPAAQLQEAVTGVVQGLERLPRLVADLESSVGSFAHGGLRLHPDSVAALVEAQRAGRRKWPIWAGAAVIAVMALALAG